MKLTDLLHICSTDEGQGSLYRAGNWTGHGHAVWRGTFPQVNYGPPDHVERAAFLDALATSPREPLRYLGLVRPEADWYVDVYEASDGLIHVDRDYSWMLDGLQPFLVDVNGLSFNGMMASWGPVAGVRDGLVMALIQPCLPLALYPEGWPQPQ